MAEEKKSDEKNIVVDQEVCIGCGNCVGIAPEHFELNDEGKSSVIKQYSVEDDKKIKDAIASCPVDAITIS